MWERNLDAGNDIHGINRDVKCKCCCHGMYWQHQKLCPKLALVVVLVVVVPSKKFPLK